LPRYDRSELETARVVFFLIATLLTLYGLGFFLVPHLMFQLFQDPGVPANPGWVRWAGALLLGTAAAAWMAGANPEGQRAVALGLATAFTLIPLALFYSLVTGDFRGVPWLSVVQIFGSSVLAVLMWLVFARYAQAADWKSKSRGFEP
jgi:hypothetical protein